jgi:DDE superfamily endonuclease/Tc5 transposase DNA-binding domain
MDPIDSVLSSFNSLKLPTSTELAQELQVHRTTISRRVKGKSTSRQDYIEKCQLLSYEQEQQLVKYIDTLTKRSLPPNHRNVRVFAKAICGSWPGENWVPRFIQRYQSEIASAYLVGFDMDRKKADNWWLINHYFELLSTKMTQYKYKPENVYNMDEKGFMLGKLQKTRRIFTRAWKDQGKLKGAAQDGSREWITLIGTVCIDGTFLPPALIYGAQSGDIQDKWLQDYDTVEDCYFASTENGWTSDILGLEWVEKVFDRATKAKARYGRDPRLLILDGHGSYINLPFLEWCNNYNIQVIAFPPYTTYRL